MIEIEDLWQRIDEEVVLLAPEEVPSAEACGRHLAEVATAEFDFPAFDHSAMDGFAFAEARPGLCKIIEEIPAGRSPKKSLSSGTAARILTGAPIPQGTFAVAMQEDCSVSEEGVDSDSELQPGAFIRRRGAIFRSGAPVLSRGEKIRPGGVALLVSCGVNSVRVFGAPKIAHIATGSELLAPNEPPVSGKIPESNGPLVEALLGCLGHRVQRCRIGDEPGRLADEVRHFDGDLLLISGGSGPGDHDHAPSALEEGGFKIHCDRLNSRPGKPLLFATRGAQAAFGLPGNPLSHWVCLQAFVRRAIERMEGRTPSPLVKTHCRGWTLPPGDGRRTWTPAVLDIHDGQAEVSPLPWLHSGDLSPLLAANALLLGSPDSTNQLISTLLL